MYIRRVGEELVIEEVNVDVPIEVAASHVDSRRVGKEPIIEHPPEIFIISDGNDSGGSGLDDEVELNYSVRDFVEDISDSWDSKDDDDIVEPGQMGAGVMNSNYESEKLHSLVESSSNDEFGYNNDDISKDDRSTQVGSGKGQKNEGVRSFLCLI